MQNLGGKQSVLWAIGKYRMKQITQIVHNKVKNPNWSEANHLAVNKPGGGFELGATEKKSS